MNFTPLTDFFSNIKDKISNPFFGTLIFVWLARNWLLVYSILSFDKKTTLSKRIEFIQTYINENYSLTEILINVGITILLIIIGYILIVLTRAISTAVEFRIMPFLTQKIISDKVVFRDDYDKVKSDRDDYSERYEEQRKQVRMLSKQFDEISEIYKNQSQLIIENNSKINELEKEVQAKDNTINSQNRTTGDQRVYIENLKSDNERLLKEAQKDSITIKKYSEQFNSLFTDYNREFLKNNIANFPEINNMYQKLLDTNNLSKFIEVYRFLINGGSINTEALNEMNELGFVYRMDNERTFFLTPIANIIYDLYVTG